MFTLLRCPVMSSKDECWLAAGVVVVVGGWGAFVLVPHRLDRMVIKANEILAA